MESRMFTIDDLIKRPQIEFKKPSSRIELMEKLLGFEQRPVFELGEKTLEKLITVREPDPSDFAWLQEKKRLTELYKTQGKTDDEIKEIFKSNKPLGRDQYMHDVQKPITQANLSVENKIKELTDEIRSGNANNAQNMATMFAQLTQLINNMDLTKDMTKDVLNMLNIAIKAMPDVTLDILDIKYQIIDNDYFKNNSGKVIMFLQKIAQKDNQLSLEFPVYNLNLQPAKIITMVDNLSKGGMLVFNDPSKGLKNNFMKKNVKKNDRVKRYIKGFNDSGLTREEIKKLFSFDIEVELQQLEKTGTVFN